MSRTLVLACVLAACSHAAPRPPAPPDQPPSPFVALADELATPAQPVWPTLPPEVAKDLVPVSVPDPIAAATSRLTGWTFDTASGARPEDLGARMREGLSALALVEPLAYGKPGTPEGRAAAGLAHRFWDALDSQAFRDWLKTSPSIGVDRKILEIVAEGAPVQRKHLAAQVLTAAEPPEAVDGVLHALADRLRADGKHADAQKLYAKIVERHGTAATVDDWLDLELADARIDDEAGATTALEKARALPAPDRTTQAKLRDAAKELANLHRIKELAASPDLAARLEAIDLLRALGRHAEADAALAQAKQAAPNDARVRVRSATIGFEAMAQAGNMLEAAGYVTQELGDDGLVNKDADYWSMMIGAQGAHAMGEALPQLFQDKVAGGKKMVEILTGMRDMSAHLVDTRPGRAVALRIVLDHAIPIIQQQNGQEQAVADLLMRGLDEVIASRAKFRDTPDLDRLVYTYAVFSADRAKALAAVMERPGTQPDDDIDLYLARARSALTLAIVIATPQAVEQARAAITDIAPSWNPSVEANREAMLGDCDAILATIARDGKWKPAMDHYLTARKMSKDVRARVTNNLGWIALQQGDAEGADRLFRSSAEDESGRKWLAYLNALVTPARAAERLEGIRSLILANSSDGKPPATLLIWLAATSPDPKEAGDAAQRALDDRKEPFSAVKPYNGALGFETEGAFQVGIGLSSRKLYELNTTAYASLWLTQPMPLDDKQLAAKAPPPAKPKPPNKNPNKK